MKRKFTFLIAAALMLLTMMATTGTMWGQTTVASFSRPSSSNNVTGGEFSSTFSAKTGYYQDANGTCYMQILNNEAYWTATPSSITLTSVIGGGSGNKDLSNAVYVVLLDSDGAEISGTQTSITTHITTNIGDEYNTDIQVTNNVYGVKIYHTKESGYNVRYYSFSLSYVEGGGTITTHSLTFDVNDEDAGSITVGSYTSSPATVAENATVNISATANSGYVFSNWTVTGEGSSVADPDETSTTFTMGTADATLTANFSEVNTYTVTYYANDGSETKTEVEYNEGDNVTIAANTFTYAGHAFIKWNTNEGGTGTDYLPNATIENIQADIDLYAQWEESSETVDYLDREFTGVSNGSTSYSTWKDKEGTSGAVYAGNSAGGNNAIQLRTTGSASGIVSTTSAGKVTKVEVQWNSNTSSGRKINIYGSNTAYKAASELHLSSTAGTLLGTIDYGSTTELAIQGDYAYIGIRAQSNPLYLDWVKITWEAASSDVVATPVISPNGGSFWESQEVSITCATNDATIYYTTNGTDPTTGSSVYSAPFTITATTTVKAFAVKANMTDSEMATAVLTKATPMTVAQALAVTPPQNGVYVGGIISEITEVSTQYHNATYKISDDGTHSSQLTVFRGKYLNGADFTSEDQIQVGDVVVVYGDLGTYNEAIQLNQNNYLVSLVRPEKVATPTFSPVAGTYYAEQSVTINCETEGATIYYTTDGTDPTTGSTEYTAAIEVSETKTIKAIGVKDGMNNSAIATATYTIVLTPSVTVTPNVINAPAAGAVGSLALTYENITDFVGFDYYFCDVNGVELEDKPNWIYAEIQEENETYSLDYLIDDNDGEARTAYIKVYTYDDDMEEVYAIVTFNQAEFVIDYATLPFSFNYGRDSIAETTGLTQSGLGSDYSDNNTKLKFDGTGDWVILKINERPGTLTFDIKGNGFSGGTFKVQTSADGTNYTDLETYDGLTSTVQSEEFTTLGENVRYIKWIYTEKVSGNVGLGNITLVQYVEPVATPTFNPEEGTYTEAQSVTITCATEGATIYYTTDGSDPTTESTEYTDAIEVATTTTIKAIGVKEGLANSAIAAATYTINIPSIVLSSYLIEATAAEKEGNLAITLENIEITEDGGGGFDMIFCDEDGNPLSDKPEWFEFDFPYENDTCSVYYLIAENTTESSREAYFKIYGLGDDGETEATSNLVTVTQAAAAQTFTVNFTLDGGTFVPNNDFTDVIVEIAAGTYNLPSATKAGFEFAGWNDGNATYEADAEYTVEADVDFTAQWTEVVGVTYELVTSTDDIVPDCYYLITSGTDGTVKAMAGQSTNNRTAVDVTASDGVISNIGEAVAFIINGNGTDLNPYTIYDENVPGYLYAAGTNSSNHLKTQNEINARAQWTITIDNDNKAIITALTTETDRKIIRYNSSSTVFSCYGSGQLPIYLFKKVDNTPTISFNGPSANIGTYPTGEEITWGNIIVSQHNLTDSISLRAKKGTVTPTSIDAGADPTEVVWSYTPTTAGYTVDTITATSGTVEATFLIQFVAKTPHKINIASVENGTIAVVGGKTKEIEGENVDFTVTPDEGYVIDAITVMAGETPVDYIQGETFYRFQMPDSDVTISATFTALPTYTVSFSVNGTVDSELTETVTTGSSIEDLPTESALTPDGFTIYGWAEANSTEAVAEPYEPTDNVTLYALLQLENAPATTENYVKVTEELTDWSGEYLIVYEDGEVAFDGSLEVLDVASNTIAVTITNNTIVATATTDDSKFTIAALSEGGYSIQSASGYYIGQTSDANGLASSTETVYANTLSYDTENECVNVISSGGPYMRYNSNSGQNRFRYFKSSTYTGQQAIQLYKKTSGAAIPTIINVAYVSDTTSMSTDIPESTCYVVEDGAVLTFTGTNEGTAANLVVQEGGQLIHTTDVEATVQKGVSAYTTSKSGDGWYLISSPVDGISTSAVATGIYDLFAYDEETAYWWVDHAIPGQPANHTFTTLERGKGYLYANAAYVNLNYAGTTKATNANITVDLSYACEYPDFKGFNLVGNPFTRNITATDMVIGENEVTSYYDFNADRTEFVTYQTNERPIQPGQGFFIQATANAQQLEFNPTTSKDASDFKYISISAGDESFTDKAYIQFGGGNTLRKMTFSGNKSQVYVMHHHEDYAAARIYSTTGSVPVNFEAAYEGIYTITLEAKNLDLETLRLIDNMTGDEIDLLAEPSYTFKANSDEPAERFTLLFEKSILGIDENNAENEVFAYQNGSEIYLSGEGTLQVFDVMGRYVASYEVNGSKRISTSLFNTGVYIFKMTGENNMTQKIVVR